MSHACKKCGTMLDEEQRFCPNCGTRTNQTRDDSHTQFGTRRASSVNSETVKFTRRKIRILGWLVLLALAVAATWIYTRSRNIHQQLPMQLAPAYAEQTQPDYSEPLPGHEKDVVPDVAKILGLVTTAADARLGPPPHFPPLAPGAGFAGKIPLRADLIIVNAVNDPGEGDYETIGHIDSVTAENVAIQESADVPDSPSHSAMKTTPSAAPTTHKVDTHRTVLRSDLLHAHAVMSTYAPILPDVIAGTTAFSVSTDLIADLKTKGQTAFRFFSHSPDAMWGVWAALGKGTDNLWSRLPKVDCTLVRDEPQDVAFPAIVNDQPVQLPAIHAACDTSEGHHVDDYILDDGDNPLGLASYDTNDSYRGQVIRISFPQDRPSTRTQPPQNRPLGRIEQQLAQNGRAEIYGIYFDFDSDSIRPESQSVLREIADVLARNPTWKLSVEGHTDNIGTDPYNLDLSLRRAAAVKRALVEEYHIAVQRLATVGFGASRPNEPNDTMQGRARNRRVELVRQ